MESSYSEHEEKPEYWFNLKSLKVEVGRLSPSPNRVGPFATSQEAAEALQTIRFRSEAWRKAEAQD
jgi:hypothetical protein